MDLKKTDLMLIGAGVLIFAVSFIFIKSQFFLFVMGFGVLIAVSPFVYNVINENKVSAQKEEMFLEFARNLVESVNTGTPISKTIVNMKKKPFGVLSPHVEKLANQITMGIPLGTALQVFARDLDNKTISRALTLIGQAEKAGGNIGQILESVARAVAMVDKLKKERTAAISTLVVQGYIIFFVFLVIILVMQFYIIPMISGIANIGGLGEIATPSVGENSGKEFSTAFLYMLLIQGFFSGLAIGKLAGGNIKFGIKHSFALMILAFVISAAANLFLGKG